MQQQILTVVSNRRLCGNIFEMKLDGCAPCKAGQFVNLELEGLFLRRPISVCDWDNGILTLDYRVIGKGTELMSRMTPGEKIDTLVTLGNGFDSSVECSSAVLVGGGIGLAPLFLLAKELLARGRKVTVVAGFKTGDEVFNEDLFKSVGADFIVATEDGSRGCKGFVTDAIRKSGVACDYIFACGPMPMMKALCAATDAPAQLSLEERMGCGFGICMGCTCKTTLGAKRVCTDGPVFKREEITW